MFQTLMSVLQKHSVVTQMLSVVTPMGLIHALVSLDIMEMGRIVKVRLFIVLLIQENQGSTV